MIANSRRLIMRIFLAVTALEGIIAGIVIWGRKSPAGGLFWNSGFTLKNVLLLSATVILVSILLSFLVSNYLFGLLRDKLKQTLENNRTRKFVIGILFYILIDSSLTILYTFSEFDTYVFIQYSRFLESLLPFQIWLAAGSFQLLVLVFVELDFGFQKILGYFQSTKKFWIIFTALGVPWLVIALSGFSFIRGTSRWGVKEIVGRFLPVTKPLPAGQVVLILILVLGASWLARKLIPAASRRKSSWLQNILAFLVIWTAAFLLWSSVPIEPNYMIDRPDYNPETIYPSSDGFYYDKEANRLLSGLGYSDNTTHVMYSTFVGVLHLLAGFDYQQVIRLQLVVLAVIPVLLYQFARELDRPATGWLTALLFIARERNGLLLGEEMAGPLANQLLSENLALLGVIIFCYLVYRWISHPRLKSWLPAAAGGVLGVFILIRAEFLALLLAAALTTLIVLWKQKTIWFKGMLGMFLAAGLIITPWMIRNYHRTGLVYLDKAGYVSKRLANFQEDGFQPQTVPDSTNSGEESDPYGGSFLIFQKHVTNSLNHLVMYLPSGYQPFWGFGNLVSTDGMGRTSLNRDVMQGLLYFSEDYLELHARLLPYYWYSWDGIVPLINLLPAAGSLLVISLGIVRLSNQRRWALLILMGMVGAQILIWAFANYSGSRHVKPVDWIPLIFYASGLIGFSEQFLNWSGADVDFLLDRNPYQPPGHANRFQRNIRSAAGGAAVAVLIIIGLSPIWLEGLFPPEFTDDQKQEWITELSGDQELAAGAPGACQPLFRNPELERILYGKALYPRFFEEGERYEDHRKGTIPESYGDRIDFYLIGTEVIWGSLPAKSSEEVFSPRSEVLILGEKAKTPENRDYFLVDCLAVLNGDDSGGGIQFLPASGSLDFQ